jgi:CRISPR/Cas system-associated endoribonuclease Cas2
MAMERENFYLLLELSCDAPETDTRVIEEAIAKKQSEWSRLRNHPTKGLRAQKCINLIPEIRRVMTDEALRGKEAEAARKISAKDRQDKYPEIDRHIDILMGKGHVTIEEAHKLARVHGLSEGEIQARIAARKNEKYHRIDQQITLRMAKGYLTESEVASIAKRNQVKADEVRKRLRCPVRKNSDTNDTAPIRQLDRSLEKTIRDNLKLLNKSSLYDFLGLPDSADLETLREQAVKKKKEVASTSKKDAVATATNTLAGHCVTLFKSDESRNAYDISLARTKLAELDSDIDIAGINGRIRPEYFEILVKKAVDFGMEEQEAQQYIKNYCRQKKWTVEMAPDKRRRIIIAGVAGLVFLSLIVAGTIAFYSIQKQKSRQADFNQLIARVKQKKEPDEKIKLLQKFLNDHGQDTNYSQFMGEVRQKISSLAQAEAEATYLRLEKETKQIIEKGNFSTAISEYKKFINSDPPPAFVSKAETRIKEIEKEIETKDFRTLEELIISGTPPEKIAATDRYLKNHPQGANADKVRQMQSDMSGEYYVYIKKELENCEAEKNWQKCAGLCRNYLDHYDNSYADQLKEKLTHYNGKIKQDRIFAALRQKASGFGTDYDKAMGVYEDFLLAYPKSPIAQKVRQEINRLQDLKKQHETEAAKERFRQLLAGTQGRFKENGRGVVTDSRTGLMWQIIDSAMAEPESCLTYEQALEYVKNLKTGGYTDWRLPTADELADIYKQPPYFPSMSEKWYWSSDNYQRYSDGWRKIVDTVGNRPGSGTTTEPRDSRQCGAVRAVREGS